MQDDQTLRRLVDVVQGTDVRYDMRHDEAGDGHPLTGGWVPNLPLVTERGELPLAALMHGARAVLLDLNDDPTLLQQAAPWRDRIDLVAARCPSTAHPEALLIRPDGYVAWAGTSKPALDRALRRWFGSPGG